MGPLTPATYKSTDTDNENIGENIKNFAATAPVDRFSVEALMMKQEPIDTTLAPIDFSYHQNLPNPAIGGEDAEKMQTDALQQTFQNLKYLFVNYAMNNVPNFSN